MQYSTMPLPFSLPFHFPSSWAVQGGCSERELWYCGQSIDMHKIQYSFLMLFVIKAVSLPLSLTHSLKMQKKVMGPWVACLLRQNHLTPSAREPNIANLNSRMTGFIFITILWACYFVYFTVFALTHVDESSIWCNQLCPPIRGPGLVMDENGGDLRWVPG